MDCRMIAVLAEPDEKERAKRACSRVATAFSKLSLEIEFSLMDPSKNVKYV